jgi:hypothetical protein
MAWGETLALSERTKMIEKLQKRLAELQQLAKQHESVLLQITGAIQEVTNMISQLEAENVAEKGQNHSLNP